MFKFKEVSFHFSLYTHMMVNCNNLNPPPLSLMFSIHLSAAHLQHPMARDDPKWRAVGASGTGTSSKTKFWRGSGAGSDTPSGSQHPAPHAKFWPGTRRERGREAGLATAGGETLSQNSSSKYKLDRSSKISAEQSAMARGRRWPMLHMEPRV